MLRIPKFFLLELPGLFFLQLSTATVWSLPVFL